RKIAASQHRSEGDAAVFGFGQHVPGVGRNGIETMDEIELAVVGYPVEQGMPRGLAGIADLVPAHMRNLGVRTRPEYFRSAGQEAQAGGAAVFKAPIQDDLAAHADSQEGFAGFDEGPQYRG